MKNQETSRTYLTIIIESYEKDHRFAILLSVFLTGIFKNKIMKKVLFICDGDNLPKGGFRFIKLLNENEPLNVKGIFFSQIDSEKFMPVNYMQVKEPFGKFKENEIGILNESKNRIVEQFESSGIKFHYLDRIEKWDKAIFVKESRFADLVVISEDLFDNNIIDIQPNYFMEETLRVSECPVMIVPENFTIIERIAVAYDGKKESMFALKQFNYLLPQFTDLPAEFVYVKDEPNDAIPDLDLLKEYACLHFNSLGASKLNFDPKIYFITWLEHRKNALLVTGSYSRSAVSNLRNPSFAERVIQEHNNPVFIAHFV